jgi:hypothetical protein
MPAGGPVPSFWRMGGAGGAAWVLDVDAVEGHMLRLVGKVPCEGCGAAQLQGEDGAAGGWQLSDVERCLSDTALKVSVALRECMDQLSSRCMWLWLGR